MRCWPANGRRARKASYLVGAPKAQLRQLEVALRDGTVWQPVREEVEVKFAAAPGGAGEEQFVLCRSVAEPGPLVAELLQHLGLHLPNTSRAVENAVEKNAP